LRWFPGLKEIDQPEGIIVQFIFMPEIFQVAIFIANLPAEEGGQLKKCEASESHSHPSLHVVRGGMQQTRYLPPHLQNIRPSEDKTARRIKQESLHEVTSPNVRGSRGEGHREEKTP